MKAKIMKNLIFLWITTLAFAADYYIATPYTAAQIDDIQYVQMNDVMYLFHPDVAPYKLTRIADNSWTCAKVDWEWGPFLDQNVTTTTITPSGTTGSITLEATVASAIFDADHVGSIWEIVTKATDTTISGTLSSATFSSTLAVEGEYLLTLEGSFAGLIKLERSNDGFVTIDTVYPKYNATKTATNIEYSGNESEPGYSYRVNMVTYGEGSCDYSLVAYNEYVAGYVEITAVTDGDTATATVQSDLASTTATTRWSEGAWSDYRGWPRAVCVYQSRLFTAGTYYMPNGIWSSRSGGDYENFLDGADADDAIIYEPAITKQNPIVWMQDKNGIICGTTGNIIRVYAGDYTSALTPGNIASERQGDASSCPLQAVLVNESMVYVDRNRRRVSDSVYDKESDSFIPVDLTVFSPEISDPCILEIAVQERPDPILWCIRGDGSLLSLTYNTAQGIAAWAVHITDGDFKSVACIPGTDEDEVWVVVERTINAATVRYVERFKPQDWGDDQNDCWFVDSGISYASSDIATNGTFAADASWTKGTGWTISGGTANFSGTGTGALTQAVVGVAGGSTYQVIFTISGMTITPADGYGICVGMDSISGSKITANGTYTYEIVADASGNDLSFWYAGDGTSLNYSLDNVTVKLMPTSISGLTHLEGETVQIFEGTTYETGTVSGGAVSISNNIVEAIIGLPYTSNLVTFPVEIQSNLGFTIGYKKAIREVFMASYKSMNCEYREYGETWYPIDFQTSTIDYIGTTAPFTGLFQLPWDGGWQSDREVQMQFRQTAPYPFGLTALVTKLEVGDD